jgi:hypothetical protein
MGFSFSNPTIFNYLNPQTLEIKQNEIKLKARFYFQWVQLCENFGTAEKYHFATRRLIECILYHRKAFQLPMFNKNWKKEKRTNAWIISSNYKLDGTNYNTL